MFLTYCSALLVLIFAGPILYVLGVNHNVIFFIEWGGTVLVIFGTMLHIVFFDSKKRWPGIRAFERFARVITFYRG